jgi:hypothetical protein
MKTALALTLLLSSYARAADSFLEEALFAGGARDASELQRLVALYHQRIDPMVEVVKDQPKEIAAKLLLKHLHVSYGGTTAVLVQYKSDAYSINSALDTGFYNCLSSTMLFMLAARQAGLDVTGELYSDHARAIARVDGWQYQVEATSQYGFGVEKWMLSTQVDRSSGPLGVKIVVQMPLYTGSEPLLYATWAWAGEPRDARWANRLTLSPPPLISAFSTPRE